MPSSQPYTPHFDFPSDPAPQRKINDVALQAELRQISDRFSQLVKALSKCIRDDDTLTDQLVRLRNLHPELSLWLQSHIDGTQATDSLLYTLPVRVASTSNLPALSGPATVDSVVLATGDRILVTGQTLQSQNGVYVVDTSGLWNRATDLPAGAVADPRFAVVVTEGTTLGSTAWRLEPLHQNPSPTQYIVNTDPIRFVQIFGPFPIPISRGGTGATTVQAARVNLAVPTRLTFDWTANGLTTAVTFSISPGTILDGTRICVTLYRRTGLTQYQLALADIYINPASITVQFTSPPANGEEYRLVAIGI